MAKDPAFLFYPSDWISGTMGMTLEEKGAYLELLMAQFNQGHMTIHMIGRMIGQNWDNIKHKFEQDENGLFFNARLELEQNRRKLYSESRRNNIKGQNQHTKKRGHMTSHMNGHMENEDEDVNEIINERRKGGKGEKQKPNPHFKPCVDLWFKFHEKRSGLSPKVNGGHFKAMKEIITYFEKSVPDHPPEECLSAVFENWDRLDKFYQKFIDIKAINSNLNAILTQIKNGTASDQIPAHWKLSDNQ